MELYSKRTRIEPFNAEDISKVIEMYNEPESFKFIKPLIGQTDNFYTKFLKDKINSSKIELEYWKVIENESGDFIGTLNLNQFASTSMTQIGCHLKRTFWNKGFATELLRTILEYAIEEKNYSEVFGIFEPENIASKRIFEKLEFIKCENQTFLKTELSIYKFTTDQ